MRANPDKYVRVSRDSIRNAFYQKSILSPFDEQKVTEIQIDMIRKFLLSKKDVLVDDTNLSGRAMNRFYNLVQEFEGRVQIRVQDFSVDYKKVIERDRLRGENGGTSVGKDVIMGMVNKRMNGSSELPTLDAKFYQPIVKRETIEQDAALPSAWLVDIDGTLSDLNGRNPYDYDKVDNDAPIEHIIELVSTLKAAGNIIVLMTGRDAVARILTEEWLKVWEVSYDHLYMRAANDTRKDSVVKKELYNAHVKGTYNVKGVLDDRSSVVQMWRSEGLFCAQVADGLF